MRHKLLHAIIDHPGLKLVSLIVAFLIWLLVSNTNNPTQTRLFNNVPITIINKESIAAIDKVVEPQGSGTVTLRVTERRSVLEKLSRTGSDFYVEADLENINEMDSVPLTVVCSNSAVTWDEIEMSPSSLKVKLEDKVEDTFVATVSASGTPSTGYEVGTTAIEEGRNILIAGPQSLIRIIGQVVAPVSVSNLSSEEVVSESTLRVIDKNGEDFTDSQLSSLEFKSEDGTVITDRVVHVTVTPWRVRSDVTVRVETTGSPAWGYNIADVTTLPETISVAGSSEALSALGRSLTLSEAVDVSGASETISEEVDLTAELSAISTELRLASGADSTLQIQVEIEKNGDVTVNVPLSAIETLNRPSDMDLVFTPADVLPVKVHRLEAAENNDAVDPESLSLTVDLSACAEEGSYELPVEVELPEGYELAQDVTIKVSSRKKTTSQDELALTFRSAESEENSESESESEVTP